jgi:hypothetical protein
MGLSILILLSPLGLKILRKKRPGLLKQEEDF